MPVTGALLDSGCCRPQSRLRTLSVFWVLSWMGRRRLSRGGRQDPQAPSLVAERQAHAGSAMHPRSCKVVLPARSATSWLYVTLAGSCGAVLVLDQDSQRTTL